VPGAVLAKAALPALLLALLAAAASAQETVPPSTPSPEPSPSPHSRWAVSATLQEKNESNAAHAADEGIASWATSLRLGAARTVERPRARLVFSADGSLHRYHDVPALNQLNWSAAAAGDVRASLRDRVRFAETVTSTYARDLQVFLDSGALPPTTVVLRSAGSLELAHRLSATASLSGWAQHEHVRIDSPLLEDGGEWALGSTAAFEIGRRQALSLTLSGRRSQTASASRTFYVSSAGWKGSLGRRFTAEATLGLVYGHFEEQRSLEPEGKAGLALRLRRVALLASYARVVGEAFGYGVQRRADVGVLSAEWTPVQRLRFSAANSYGSSRQIGSDPLDIRTRSHSVDAHWTPVRELTFSTGYGFLRRNPVLGVAPVSSHTLRLSVSAGHEWP
jgi:hypothetical protein